MALGTLWSRRDKELHIQVIGGSGVGGVVVDSSICQGFAKVLLPWYRVVPPLLVGNGCQSRASVLPKVVHPVLMGMPCT